MQKPSLNVSQKELFTILCCICTSYLFSVRYCEIVLADGLYCKKFRNQSLPAFAQRNSFVSVFNKVENTLLLNICLELCAVFSTCYQQNVGLATMCTNQIYKADKIFV